MAVRDDIKAQREKLKGAPFKKKAAYYLYYYKIHIVVIALIAIVAAGIIHSQVTTKPAVFTVMFINVENTHTTDDTDQLLEKKVADIAGIDTSKNSVDMDMTSTLTPGGARDQMDLGILSKIQARTMNKELDVMAADAWNFNYLAGQAYFTDLRTVLSDKELARYSDDIYYADKTELDKLAKKMQDPDYVQQNVEPEEARKTEKASSFEKPDPSKMDDPVPIGIILNEGTFVKKHGIYSKTVGVAGIVQNSANKKTADALISILMD